MSVSIRRIDGVESADLSLNRGRGLIRLRPGNTVGLNQIRERIRRNGFTPQEAAVTMRAQIVLNGGSRQLKVLGTDDSYQIADTPGPRPLQSEIERLTGQIVMVEGVIPPPRERAPAGIAVFIVKRVQPAGNQ